MRQTKWIVLFEHIYGALLVLYPTKYRLEYSSAMVQIFRDMCRRMYHEHGRAGLARWWVVTLTDLVRTAMEQHIEEHSLLRLRPGQGKSFNMTIQKWGGLASFVLAVSLVVSNLIYLTGNLRDANGVLAYDLADFLYGPVRAVCLIAAVYALRAWIGEHAPRLMSLMMLVAVLAAGMFVMAALFRSTNRHYHLMHPDLHLESSSIVLTIWTTLLAGVIATGWHFLGWVLVLLGWAGWTNGRFPRVLSVLYWVVGAASLIVYLLPETEMNIAVFAIALSIWQGILLWRAVPEQPQPLTVNSEAT